MNPKDKEKVGEIVSQLSHLVNSYYSYYKPTVSTLKKYRILKRLQNNREIVILRPDKRNGIVIMNRKDYICGMNNIINDRSKFKLLTEDPTPLQEEQLQSFLRKLKNEGFFNDDVYKSVYPTGSRPARMYSLPKLHKIFDSVPAFRPILSSIGTYNYQLAKFLGKLLDDVIPNDHSTKDTFSFVEELKMVSVTNKYLVSYDVTSLFTNIPLEETINLTINLLFEAKPDLNISRKDLQKLFQFATSQTNFLFNGNMYDQVDGVAMGLPLAPILANIFMGYHEKEWIRNYNYGGLHYYKRYVNDIFAVFETKDHALSFYNYINRQHRNIKFTMETKKKW